ncbi:MAG: Gfo/Idh/MocA family oxidoreductase [Spirochaetales bacterium]|nr:Gfo/Idh/MocA family oxidoreductase [Spirochaetales bacterium]
MSGKIRVLLAGYGLAGRFIHGALLRALSADFEVAAVLERTPGDAAAEFPAARIVRDLDAALAAARELGAELAIVATPTALHAAHARAFLEAGLHVLVDKPAGLDHAEVRATADAAAVAGRLFAPFHNRRHDSDFLSLREVLASGRLGRVVAFEARWDRFRPAPKTGAWREEGGPGSGVLLDLGPHLVDQTLLAFGTPRSVAASVRSERGGKSDDAFELLLHYEEFECRLGSSSLGAFPGARFHLRGTAGSWLKRGIDPQEAPLRAGKLPGGADWGLEAENERGELISLAADGSPVFERTEAGRGDWRRFYRELGAALRGEGEPPATAEDALRVARVLDLARGSSARGGTPLEF